MTVLFLAIFLFCSGVAIIGISTYWINKQLQLKARAAVVIGKWAGFKIANHRTDVGTKYCPTVTYHCPFTKQQKTLIGMGSTGGHTWRQAGDPVPLLIDRLPPYLALRKTTWLTFISLGILGCVIGFSLTMFILVKEVSHLKCSNWVQSFVSTGCGYNLPEKRQ
jgi:Na+/H+ antiporter NhaA